MEEDVWRYRGGTWAKWVSPIEFEDEDGVALDSLDGYAARTRWFGDEDEFGVEVYSAEVGGDVRPPTPYLAMVYNVGDNVERVFVEDFPSLIQFLREMAPILDMTNQGLEPEDLDDYEEEEDGQEQ